MLSIIVAIDEKNWIWSKNQLLCHLSDDLKNFKKITNWHTIIMGKNTFFSLPNWALPNRTNIVLSHSSNDFKNCIHCKSIEECLNLEEVKKEDETFVIWWASIYKEFFDLVDKLYITRIHHTFPNADVFFPEIENSRRNLVSKSDIYSPDEKNEYPFNFEIYEKIK
jgi:dihydrofolate reductase